MSDTCGSDVSKRNQPQSNEKSENVAPPPAPSNDFQHDDQMGTSQTGSKKRGGSAFTSWTTERACASGKRPVCHQQVLKNLFSHIAKLQTHRQHRISLKLKEAEPTQNSATGKTAGDEVRASDVLAERRRREKLHEKLIVLRSLIPFVPKMEEACILGGAIEYMKQLRQRIQELEIRNREMEAEILKRELKTHLQHLELQPADGLTQETQTCRSKDEEAIPVNQEDPGKPLLFAVEAEHLAGPKDEDRRVKELDRFEKSCKVEVSCNAAGGDEALIELTCASRDEILLDILQTLKEKSCEVYSVKACNANGNFHCVLKAKVRTWRASTIRSIDYIFRDHAPASLRQ